MQRDDDEEDEREQPGVVQPFVLQPKLSDSCYRTRALFAAEEFLQRIAVRQRNPDALEAQTILEHYPTKLDLMRMSEEHPMLNAAEAQRLVTRRERLDI